MNADPPLFSIITPSFNQGTFLAEAIESVLSQSFTDFEYIIIDSESSDDSVEIIQSYERQLSYWVSEPDTGQSNGINKGFRRAKGNLVAWLNADDLYLPGCLESVAHAFRANPNASFYYGNGYRGDRFGKPKDSFFSDGTVQYSQRSLAYGLNYVLQPSTFISRDTLKTIGYLREHLNFGMDTDLWLRLASVCPPVAMTSHLSISREYGTTKTSTGSFQRVEELRQIACDHTGLETTPGAILYYLDCLNKAIAGQLSEPQSPFSGEYQGHLVKFWKQTAKLLDQYQTGEDGIPRKIATDD